MERDRKTDRPPISALIHLAWSFLWRAIGIGSLVYFGVGLIAVATFYVVFVLCHAPSSVGRIIVDHCETPLVILFALGCIISPVVAFRMMIGKRLGHYRLTLARSTTEGPTPSEMEEG